MPIRRTLRRFTPSSGLIGPTSPPTMTRLLPLIVILSLVVSPLALLVWPQTASAALPSGFSESDAASASGPTALAFLPDGRMLIAQKGGQVLISSNGSNSTAIDIGSRVCADFERGLLGVAVDPGFTGNGFVYLYYTFNRAGSCVQSSSGELANSPVNRVSRFALAGGAGTETVLIDNMPSPAGNHNAGDVQFGQDGLLYVSIGDGGCDYAGNSGCAGANDAARDSHVLTGKILRITSSGGIPGGNPYAGSGDRCNVVGRTTPGRQCQETFASGLRNPYRIIVDRNPGAGRIYVNDVGQGAHEEVDNLVAGADYGWNCNEGNFDNPSRNGCDDPLSSLTGPILDYAHSSGCRSITGGAFIPNGLWPAAYAGGYLYGDYVCGKIFMLRNGGVTDFQTSAGGVVHLTFGPSGASGSGGQALYYADINAGKIRRITYGAGGNQPPEARMVATPLFGALPLNVSFDGRTSTDPNSDPLTYEWNFGDGTPTAAGSRTTHRYDRVGPFTATLTVRDGRGGTDTATVRIDAGNTPPTPTIQAPTTATRYTVGQQITLTGTATDAQDGTLPPENLSWEVILHHDIHTHPFFPATVGNNLVFTAPPPEDLAAAETSYLEIKLTATDESGLSRTISQDLPPKKVDVTFATTPPGLGVQVNGTTLTGPETVVSFQGYVLNVNAPDQTVGGQAYEFASWSDGGGAAHQITTGAAATTHTANFTTATGGEGPSADARVLEASPGSNYGASTALVVEGGSDPDVWTYLRFDTGDLDGAVTRATVRLYCYSGTSDGPAIYQSLNTTWSESGLTWANRPARRPGAIDDRGAIPTGTWVEFDVTPRVTAEGTYTFVLVSVSTDAASFRAKEFGGGFAPQLVIETSGADTQDPTTPSGLTGVVPANQSLRVDLRWTASTDNIGVTGYDIFRDGNLLQTVGTITSFSDTAVAAGETYEYRVRALDAAGNRSANSNAATVVVPSEPPSGTTLNPDRDARVQEANPTTNYGTSPVLKAEGASDPDVESYLRFTVANPGGTVQSARLRLFVTDGSTDAPALYTTSTSWTEPGITWSTRPARSASPVADAGAIAVGSWVEYDVTSVVRGGGTYGFVLASGSSDGANFSSRQGSNPPQLLLTVAPSLAAAAEPDPTPSPETAGTPIASPVASEPATETTPDETPTLETAPTEPTAPAESTEPAPPTESTDPAPPTESTDPAPTDPAQPADPAPTEPAAPTVWQPFTDGFETGDLTAWTESTGLGIGADAVRGSLAAVASRTGAEGGANATGTFAQKGLAPVQTDLYARLLVNRYDGGEQSVAILSLLTESGATAFTLAFGPDGNIVLVDAAGNVVTSWVKLDEPGWHELQLHLQTGSGLVELWVDGQLVHQAGANLGGLPLAGLILGDPLFQPGRAYTLAFDDIAVDITCIGSCSGALVTPTPTPAATEPPTPTSEPTPIPTEPPVPTEPPPPTEPPIPLPTETPAPPPPTETPVPPPPPTEIPPPVEEPTAVV